MSNDIIVLEEILGYVLEALDVIEVQATVALYFIVKRPGNGWICFARYHGSLSWCGSLIAFYRVRTGAPGTTRASGAVSVRAIGNIWHAFSVVAKIRRLEEER